MHERPALFKTVTDAKEKKKKTERLKNYSRLKEATETGQLNVAWDFLWLLLQNILGPLEWSLGIRW